MNGKINNERIRSMRCVTYIRDLFDLDFSALEYSYFGRAVSGFNDCGELLALFDSVWCIAVDA